MRHNPDMTFYEAVGWTQRAARELAAKPPPTPREADDTGLSGATWSPIVGYSMTDASAPVDAHMAAIQALRTHSRTQLNTEEWEQAHKAILSQFRRETGRDEEHVVKPQYNVYVLFHAESMEALDRDPTRASDEDVKTWDTVTVKPGLWLHIPKTREGNAPIWYGFPGEMPPKATVCYEPSGRKWWVLHDAATWPRIAANLEFSDPAASKFILKNMRAWAKQIGQSIPDHLPFTPGPILIGSPPLDRGVRIEVHASTYKGVKPGIWIDFPYSVSLNTALHSVNIAAKGYLKDNQYWRVFPPSALYDLAEVVRYYHFRTAEFIRNHMDEWSERIRLAAAFEPSAPPARSGNTDLGKVADGNRTYSWKLDKPNLRVLFDLKSAGTGGVVGLRADSNGTADMVTEEDWSEGKRGSAFFCSVPLNRLAAFAEAIEKKHPALAAAVRENTAQVWGAIKSEIKQTKERGVAEGGDWLYQADGEPTLTFKMTDKAAPGALNWVKPAGGMIASGVATLPLDKLGAAIAAIRAQGGLQALAAEMEARSRTWATNLTTGRGVQSGVSWSLSIPSGTVRLGVVGAAGMRNLVPGSKAVVINSRDYLIFNEKQTGKVADLIRSKHPRLAEALNRAFGGAHAVMDEDVERCAKLGALSAARATSQGKMGAVDFTDIAAPEVRAEVEATAAQLAREFPAGLTPFPYQVIGATFAKLSGYRCLIADEPGLGKTIQALACIALDPAELLPALVIAPASVCGSWMQQTAKWLPKVPSWYLEKEETPLPPPGFKGVVVASWDSMRSRKVDMLAYGFQFFVADEAHKAKNLGSSQTQAARLLAQGPNEREAETLPPGSKAIPHVLFLSGTPVKNTVVDLWPQLSAIDKEAWGKLAKFKEKYATLTAKRTIPGYERMSEEQQERAVEAWEARQEEALGDLRDRLRCTMIRRLKKDAVDLPPKYRVTVAAPLRGDIVAEYRRASTAFLKWLAAAVKAKMLELGFDPQTADEDAMAAVDRAVRAEAIVQIGRLREIAGRGKIPAAIRMGQRLARAGEPFLYFCDHKEVVTALKKALKAEKIPFGVIDGDHTGNKRTEAVDAFQSGKLQALICTTAAKEGLTLTRAAVTLFVEHFWTAADEQQAEDRIHRITQTRPVTIAYLHAPGTIDDYMAEIISGKRSLTADIMGAEETDQDDNDEERRREEAQERLVHSMVKRLQITEDVVLDAFRDADPGLAGWLDAHDAEARAAIHDALYPEGPTLEPEERVADTILTRLRDKAPRTNPRRAWR